MSTNWVSLYGGDSRFVKENEGYIIGKKFFYSKVIIKHEYNIYHGAYECKVFDPKTKRYKKFTPEGTNVDAHGHYKSLKDAKEAFYLFDKSETCVFYPYSVLVLNGEIAGLRVRDSYSSYHDIEVWSITSKELFNGLKFQNLIPYKDSLVTEEEMSKNITIKDRSDNIVFCDMIFNSLLRKNSNGKIKLYRAEVMLHDDHKHTLSGVVEAENSDKARSVTKRYFVDKLGVSEKDVRVISVRMLV